MLRRLRECSRHGFSRCTLGFIKRRSSINVDHVILENEEQDLELQNVNAHQSCRVKVFLFFAIVLILICVFTQLPLKIYVVWFSDWIKTHSFCGTLVAIVLFWIAIPLCIPSTLIEAISGSIFGVGHGLIVILIGKTGGSLVAFSIGRYIGKAVVDDYLKVKFPAFRALVHVFNSTSWKPIMLFQLSSIPNLVKCYSLAVTNISSYRFAVSSMVTSTPHAIMWANIGSQANDIAAILSGEQKMSTERICFLVSGIVLTIVAMGYFVVYTRQALHKLQKQECCSGSESDMDADVSPLVGVGDVDTSVSSHIETIDLQRLHH